MIGMRTILEVADNSGARKLQCILPRGGDLGLAGVQGVALGQQRGREDQQLVFLAWGQLHFAFSWLFDEYLATGDG